MSTDLSPLKTSTLALFPHAPKSHGEAIAPVSYSDGLKQFLAKPLNFFMLTSGEVLGWGLMTASAIAYKAADAADLSYQVGSIEVSDTVAKTSIKALSALGFAAGAYISFWTISQAHSLVKSEQWKIHNAAVEDFGLVKDYETFAEECKKYSEESISPLLHQTLTTVVEFYSCVLKIGFGIKYGKERASAEDWRIFEETQKSFLTCLNGVLEDKGCNEEFKDKIRGFEDKVQNIRLFFIA